MYKQLRLKLIDLAKQVDKAPDSEYKNGYFQALYDTEEFIQELAWDAGEDVENE